MRYNEQDIVLTISFYNEVKEEDFIFKIWRTIYETHDKYDTRHDDPPSDVPIKMEDIYWSDEKGDPVTDKQDVFIQALLKTGEDFINAKFLAAYDYFLTHKEQDKTQVVINIENLTEQVRVINAEWYKFFHPITNNPPTEIYRVWF